MDVCVDHAELFIIETISTTCGVGNNGVGIVQDTIVENAATAG